MSAPDQKVVTLASLRRPTITSESVPPPPESVTPEDELNMARYEQMMQRLQDATDAVGQRRCSHRAGP